MELKKWRRGQDKREGYRERKSDDEEGRKDGDEGYEAHLVFGRSKGSNVSRILENPAEPSIPESTSGTALRDAKSSIRLRGLNCRYLLDTHHESFPRPRNC